MPKATKDKPLSLTNCSIALAAAVIGDRWSLLILRELFHGASRFGEFADILGVARNLLAERLKNLEANGLVARFALPQSPGRDGYCLTTMGESTFPIIAALMQWGDQWLDAGAGAPVVMQDRRTGQALGVAVAPINQTSHSIPSDSVCLSAGPGSKPGTQARMLYIEARHLKGNALVSKKRLKLKGEI